MISIYIASRKKEANILISFTNASDSGEIWYIVSWINLLKNHVNFLLYLNNVSTVDITLRHLKCSSHTCYHWAVRESNSEIYPTLTVASKFARFESSWLQRKRNIARQVYKTRITDLDEPKQHTLLQMLTTWTVTRYLYFVGLLLQIFRSGIVT